MLCAKLARFDVSCVSGDGTELIWGILMAGKLYIVATPIGNLEDISPRVARTLNEVEAIFAEDTRVSIKLLSHLGISKTLISCHDFNEEARLIELERWSDKGAKIALISDAGTPLISDPGFKFARKAIDLGMDIITIPGPSAPIMALVGSGLPCERFAFEGFLPEKAGTRKARMEKIRDDDRTLIFFMPINDIPKILPEMIEIFGDRAACLARELSKKFEEYIRGTISDILRQSKERELKGECVFLIAGTSVDRQRMSQEELNAQLKSMLDAGARLKEASGILAKESGWSSSEIYKLGLKINDVH